MTANRKHAPGGGGGDFPAARISISDFERMAGIDAGHVRKLVNLRYIPHQAADRREVDLGAAIAGLVAFERRHVAKEAERLKSKTRQLGARAYAVEQKVTAYADRAAEADEIAGEVEALFAHVESDVTGALRAIPDEARALVYAALLPVLSRARQRAQEAAQRIRT